MKFKLAGDSGIMVEFENVISEKVNSKVRKLYMAISEIKLEGINEVIPAYRSLLVIYNPLKIEKDKLIDKFKKIERNLSQYDIDEPRIIEIPTVYGGKYGPDLSFVAEYNQLSEEEVIKIHTKHKYLVYMLGFTPGFAYLGGMSEKIATPRLEEPREKIPGGSVGIAGDETGIYPIDSPGGWRLIGRTPRLLFDPYRKSPFLIRAGDYIKFKQIDEKNFKKIKKEVENFTGRGSNGKSNS